MKILRGKNLTVQQEYVRMVCLISFQQDTETRFTTTNPMRSAQIEVCDRARERQCLPGWTGTACQYGTLCRSGNFSLKLTNSTQHSVLNPVASGICQERRSLSMPVKLERADRRRAGCDDGSPSRELGQRSDVRNEV